MNARFFSTRMTAAWLAAVLTGLLAAATPWLDTFRPMLNSQLPAHQFVVTSGADTGTGSLREAIFQADRAEGRARILIEARAIELNSPLPPIVNTAGVVMEAVHPGVQINARRLGNGPVLDIAGSGTSIVGLTITDAPAQAVLLRTSGVRLTRFRVQRAAVGVFAVDNVGDLRVTDSAFEDNGIGIQLGAGAVDIRLRNNRFHGHARAAVWSVAPTTPARSTTPAVAIDGNQFDGDETSVVLMNVVARVGDNTFTRARTAALLLKGSAVTVRDNRVRSGLGFGISASDLDHSVIAGNEINHNCAGGILVRESRGTLISSNRLYSNGYGIVMVLGSSASPNIVADNIVMRNVEGGLYIIGSSPLIRRNRMLANDGIGLRLSSLRAKGHPIVESRPLVEDNLLSGNSADAPVLDEFLVATERGASTPVQDCAWRGGPAVESGLTIAERVR